MIILKCVDIINITGSLHRVSFLAKSISWAKSISNRLSHLLISNFLNVTSLPLLEITSTDCIAVHKDEQSGAKPRFSIAWNLIRKLILFNLCE